MNVISLLESVIIAVYALAFYMNLSVIMAIQRVSAKPIITQIVIGMGLFSMGISGCYIALSLEWIIFERGEVLDDTVNWLWTLLELAMGLYLISVPVFVHMYMRWITPYNLHTEKDILDE